MTLGDYLLLQVLLAVKHLNEGSGLVLLLAASKRLRKTLVGLFRKTTVTKKRNLGIALESISRTGNTTQEKSSIRITE